MTRERKVEREGPEKLIRLDSTGAPRVVFRDPVPSQLPLPAKPPLLSKPPASVEIPLARCQSVLSFIDSASSAATEDTEDIDPGCLPEQVTENPEV